MDKDNISTGNLCACGCGQLTTQGKNGRFNRFVLGHNVKNSKTNSTSNNVRPGQFEPGNTYGKGRSLGSKNNVTIAAENLLQGESEALSRKLIELALNGNVACLKTAIERLVPVCKSKPVTLLDMPKIENISEAATLTSYVLSAVAEGKISPAEGEILSRSCERHLKALEVRDLEKRLADLEIKVLSKSPI